MKKLFLSFLMMLTLLPLAAANKYDNPDTIVVSRDGTGEFRTIDEAIEVCRAFMEYTKVIYVKKGVYKEKLIIPSWLTNIIICGEDRDQTIITWDDHANIKMPVGGLDSEAAVKGKPMGTFRTYTLKVQGSYITLKNITIENNAGWHNWGKQSNEQTARYSEYNNHGAGAATKGRVAWSHQLTKKEAAKVTIKNVFGEEAW